MCEFYIAWVGKCNSPSIKGKEYCEKHVDLKCGVCGSQAVKQCSTASSLVCGYPLCAKCECPICGL